MTATTLSRSAYPTAVDDLIPLACAYTAELGKAPTRNQLMKRFRIGAPKANLVLAALAEPEPAPPESIVWVEDEAQRVFGQAEPLRITDVRGPEFGTPPFAPAPDNTPEPPAPDDITTAEQVTEQAAPVRRPVTWPVLILCLPAFVAIWAGWVEMGRLTGFGKVTLLPGIADGFQVDTAITLPIGVETYAAYALWVWLSGRVVGEARRFAKRSAIASLALGGLGQITYHLMTAWHWTAAPWPITALVACIPVAVLGMGAALAHLMHAHLTTHRTGEPS
ncbi:ABC transporter permease [Krasilnikovia sp. MM14-A1004]|uniref:ABC transporter permease n=1 Tax=Krasilnikovia sp. MM14-A1004 TaxID=3373541 RepID=UPI00399CDD83